MRASLLNDFGIEIGTSFGPLKGRIWRIGTMGYNCRKQNTLACLAALEAALRQQGFAAPAGAAVDQALAVYREAERRASVASAALPRRRRPAVGKLVWLAVNGRALAARR